MAASQEILANPLDQRARHMAIAGEADLNPLV
jgi:hypothetical protein